VDQQLRACQDWPVPEFPAGYFEPVLSDVPVLLLAGGMDPVTPAAWAEQVSRTLSRSRLIVFEDLGHVPFGIEHMECYDQLVASFLDRGNAAALDTSCIAGMTAPPFRTQSQPPAP